MKLNTARTGSVQARICRFNHDRPGEVPRLQWLVCQGGAVTWTRGKSRARFFTANKARHLAHKLGGMPAYREMTR